MKRIDRPLRFWTKENHACREPLGVLVWVRVTRRIWDVVEKHVFLRVGERVSSPGRMYDAAWIAVMAGSAVWIDA